MKKYLEKSGKTEDEALAAALVSYTHLTLPTIA